ncbi:ROK family protein [Acidomonas methanolica]|uniref:Glucokinase n=1 Tax=Acidomonas methanolica NBRC 104435 TaxID=1231351 RepID=A0A023D1A1_ACIMT|nr:ROK family protein [Acidomonas methanolica]MBU2652793.1 ROK family protein [Acidomonas methanolica]TCS31197.1 glucokinase [Acidomonas methanolica]GAJ27907.1 glucokinase [Acidomonas methanolica NBRC 104435]GBQ50821.1 glucokinase [Acidomonas methanolica]GEK98556.1 sugar kinase [Acidomonas methanolica NBRC 104435]
MPSSYAIGIDVGATKIAAAWVNMEAGALGPVSRIPTRRDAPGETIVDDIVALAGAIAPPDDARDQAAAGIGVAVPELVDLRGEIRSAWNFPLPGLVERLACVTRAPARAESDVRAAAFAEARFGAGRGCDNFAYFSLGSGMSFTLCLHGRPYAGAHGFAIHFASSEMAVPVSDRSTLAAAIPEEYASGLGMARLWEDRGGDPLPQGVHSLDERAAQGDLLALGVIADGAGMGGRLIAQAVNMLDPEKIVLGGGLGCSTGVYRAQLESQIRAHIWERSCADIPLLVAGLGEEAGIIGAALAACAAR